ncbi:MAG: hypothetical protein PF483_07245 [Halothiobacillus sp.]|nr:hypothetical protein [Halothiobacillus sp.]
MDDLLGIVTSHKIDVYQLDVVWSVGNVDWTAFGFALRFDRWCVKVQLVALDDDRDAPTTLLALIFNYIRKYVFHYFTSFWICCQRGLTLELSGGAAVRLADWLGWHYLAMLMA